MGMTRLFTILLMIAVLLGTAWGLYLASSLSGSAGPLSASPDVSPESARRQDEAQRLPPVINEPQIETLRQVYDISLHTEQELEALLTRLEQLARHPSPAGQGASVALVLHGPEVAFFAIRNYPRYKTLVDLAARLDAFDIIEVKACQTQMRMLGVEQEELPAFIEPVPFGPDEVERLRQQNYLVM